MKSYSDFQWIEKFRSLCERATLPPRDIQRPIMMYGAGGFSEFIAPKLVMMGYEIAGFIDKNKRTIAPWPTYSMEEVDVSQFDVAISILNTSTDIASIRDELFEAGASKIWSPVELFHLAKVPGNYYWLVAREFILSNKANIEHIFSKIHDDKSAATLFENLQYRILGDIRYLPVSDGEEYQYIPRDIDFEIGAVRLLDCGAYIGDTIEKLITHRYNVEAIMAIEPDPDNFKKLFSYVQGLYFKEKFVYQVGVSSENRESGFLMGNGAASRCIESKEDEFTIRCLPLDLLCTDFAPNFLKMDIEGAEKNAIDGAIKTLRMYKPNLAISAYHCPEDIWEIITKIDSIGCSYQWFFRSHGEQCFDLILYGKPK